MRCATVSSASAGRSSASALPPRRVRRHGSSVGALLGLVAVLGCLLSLPAARGEDGYRLWLRYDPVVDPAVRQAYVEALGEIVIAEPTGPEMPAATLAAARDELVHGLRGLLGTDVPVRPTATAPGALLVGTTANAALLALVTETDLRAAGPEGYIVRQVKVDGRSRILLLANHEVGVLYGAFALLRHLQLGEPLTGLNLVSAPRIQRRLLNHWDNLNRTVERGYAGQSLWDWFILPDYLSPRYRDYARACASLGLNGTVLTNVNANALVLTPAYLEKVAALAGVFRPYGIRVYLTARFSAPKEIGGLPTADPLDAGVKRWWRAKVDEIYRHVPDFGGFLVKANSEGQPGPQDYGRNHADGANLLADVLAPHNGVVIWRAFVYDANVPDDRAKQAYTEFRPLDGQFRDNVIVQVKNGPIDFMPREPFHPLFGAMPRTPLCAELQITQEYLGGAANLAFLAPMWSEVLTADTQAAGPGSTVGRVVDGSFDLHGISMIAGVANLGSDRNWTGHPLAQANWYAFGRLAWDHTLPPAAIANEWTRLTYGNAPAVVAPLTRMLLESREAVVNYEMPLGLHHLMAEGHHYGPGPWVDHLPRADWNSVYYHRADAQGIGFDRSANGSNGVAQYATPVAQLWGDPARCPDEFLLWFHHLPWDHRMRSGRTLWDEICLHYQLGVDTVRAWLPLWAGVQDRVDAERWAHVDALLRRQEQDARTWRDACILYFQTFARRPIPNGVEQPEHHLEYYKAIQLRYVPGDPSAK
ncbi:alpha-glucuronidase family glycosyl hydrolase [Opitutus sp. ER46]|uniref:alpha-glucuronidase family glycosyl hydrolase n=1 Tax=Opitutus sp. ER46 TaxID=2161864 RepID=UPI000D30005A|nr:alpha-glucuronidase family glycosyl hydrolase [Opitutus sp. ER46]PTX91559.1 alpha-glucuronidase [Opitutus sp. ER46]